MESNEPAVLELQARTIEATIYQLQQEVCRLRRRAHRIEREQDARRDALRDLVSARRWLGEQTQEAMA